MGRRQIATLARFTLLEAWRTRLPWLFVIALALVFGAGYLVHQLAITESARMQTAFSAAASRLVAVFVLSLYILTSLVREFNDKGLELTLSFALRRADYVLGRFLGFLLIAVVMALLAGVPQMMLASRAGCAPMDLFTCAGAHHNRGAQRILYPDLRPVDASGKLRRRLLPARARNHRYSVDQFLRDSRGRNTISAGIGWVIDGLALMLPALTDLREAHGWWTVLRAGRQSAAALCKH